MQCIYARQISVPASMHINHEVIFLQIIMPRPEPQLTNRIRSSYPCIRVSPAIGPGRQRWGSRDDQWGAFAQKPAICRGEDK